MINLKKYFQEVIKESKLIEFPSKDYVFKTSTWIAIVVSFTSCVIWLSDFIISTIIRIIFGLN